jgi:multidrug efflux pump subunit AcrB
MFRRVRWVSAARALNGERRLQRDFPKSYGQMLGLAILFAYLFLVALYESWNIPLSALL